MLRLVTAGMLAACLVSLAVVPAWAQTACGPGRTGCYRAADGTYRDAEADYRRMTEPRDQDRLRLAGEYLVFLGGGALWYVIDDRNVADWDYESLQQRLTLDAFRYDTNSFAINFIYHPLSGAAFHAFARSNDLGLLESIAWGLLVSGGWEVALEFKERISINDTLVTTGAGIPLGEFVYKLGLHLRDGPEWLRWLLAFPVAFHDAWDGVEPDGPSHYYTRFRFSYDVGATRVDGGDAFAVHGLAFDGTIASIPGYLREGRFERFFSEADVVSLRFRTSFGQGTGLEVLGDTILLGMHRQEIAQGGGDAITFGTSLAWLYRAETHGRWHDELSILGLPGLAVDAFVLRGPVALRISARGWGTFSGVESHAFDAWKNANTDQHAKSILEREGYYYAWGLWARLEAELAVGPVAIFGHASWATFDSHEGLDRHQSDVTADVQAYDDAVEYAAGLRFAGHNLYLELGAVSESRRSRVEQVRETQRLVRAQATLGLQVGDGD